MTKSPINRKSLLCILWLFSFFHVVSASAQDNKRELFNKAARLFKDGQYDEAAQYYDEAITGLQDHDLYEELAVESLDQIAMQFEQVQRLDIATQFHARKAYIQESVLGTDHPDLAKSYNDIGVLLFALGDYQKARRLFETSLEIRISALAPGHASLVESYNNLGMVSEIQGDYALALDYFGKCLSAIRDSGGEDSLDVAKIHSNLANVHLFVDDYSKAMEHYTKGLTIRQEIMGAESQGVADSYLSIGSVFLAKGDYAKALDYYEKSYSIRSALKGEADLNMAVLLGRLGSVYMALGNPNKAQEYIQRSMAIRLSLQGEEHPDIGSSYFSLATSYYQQGKHRQASDLFRKSLAIKMKTYGSSHPDIADICNNMANIYYALGKHEEALKYYKLGRDIRVDIYGLEHPSVAGSLNNMAIINTVLRNYSVASDLYTTSHSIQENSFGKNNPHVAQTRKNMSITQHLADDSSGALSSARSAAEANLNVLRRELPTLSARERSLFLSAHDQGHLDVLLSLALGADTGVVAAAERESALWVVRTKGLILSTLLEDRELLHNVPEAGPLTDRLRATKAQLSALLLQQVTGESTQQREAREVLIRELAAQSEEQQRELARLAARQRAGRPEPEAIEITDVQQALAAGQVLIEFYRFRPLSDAEQHKESGSLYLPAEYAVIVIRPDVEESAVLSLGDAESLDDLVHQCQTAMRAGEPTAKLLKKLHYLIWAPLAEHIGDAGRVYISPDSELSFVPFAALLRPDGTYLCEHHEIGYVASGRDLLMRLRQGDAGAPALFGNPAFGEEQGEGGYLDRGAAFRSVLGTTDRAVLSGIRFPALPGTQREVQALKGALKASEQNPVAYLGLEATESRLKALQRPGLLHLATHGFFLPDIEQEPANRAGMLPSLAGADSMSAPIRVENPMLRSGLALTGAALASVGRKGVIASDTEDGIVTAEEVSSLDLSSTRMVVLSACDTGVGEARAGQGVMGLRRAFAHAGAQNLVMTLWPVQDEATVNLMVSFYDRYLETGDAVGALSHLQRSSIARSREAGDVPDPRVWGPFLISVQGNE